MVSTERKKLAETEDELLETRAEREALRARRVEVCAGLVSAGGPEPGGRGET